MAAPLIAAMCAMSICGCGNGSGAAPAGPLQYILTIDKPSYGPGEAVTYTYTVTNTSDNTISLQSSLVRLSDGSLGGIFTTITGSRVVYNLILAIEPNGSIDLPPHSSASVHESWNQADELTGRRVPPGRYVLEAGIDYWPGALPARYPSPTRSATVVIR